MNIFQRFFYTLYRPIDWKRSSHEAFDQWKPIQVNDIVEAAVEVPNGIRYRVETIDQHTLEARVARLADDGATPLERYTLALKMLRPLAPAKQK
jgi:hypothetical protein